MSSDRDRLIELVVNADTYDSYECKLCTKKDTSCGRCNAEKLADYLLANGVIVPPCKVGDKIYQLDTAGDIYESELTQIIYNTKGIAFDERAIGKTVFLTKEEAEQALAERSADNE